MGTDTIAITIDTLINGRKFYLEKGTFFGGKYNMFITDSANFIIHDDGHRLFSNSNFTDTLLISSVPNYSTTYYKMSNKKSIVQVPAGTFNTIERDKITVFHIQNYPYGNPRTASRYFAKGVGFVKEREYYDLSPDWLERRLVTYFIAY